MIIGAGILGVALLLSVFVAGKYAYNIRAFDNGLSVTGSAQTNVTADSVKWTSSIQRVVTETALKTGYAQMSKDAKIVSDFFKKQGIADENVTVSTVFADQIYKYDANNNGPREYTLRQTFTISSTGVEKVSALAKNIQGIVDQGVVFSASAPEYYYSKLASLRVSLLGDAIKDAKARAEQLANSSGQKVGALKSASSGVVQVLAPNSIDVSDYGQYDTQSINKTVMVTARATFILQ